MDDTDSAGFSVFEFVVATAISIPLLLLLLQTITVVHELLLTANERKVGTVASVALYRAMEQISADLDSHPFELLPRLHSNGRFTFYDGTRVPQQQIGLDSVGVTSIRLRFPDLLLLNTSGSLTRTGCMFFRERGNLLSGSPIHSVLLVASTGLHEALVSIETTSDPRCYHLTIRTPEKSMIGPLLPERELSFVRVAIPIDWVQTFFRDRNHDLRALRFAGARIILNQPVATNVPKFELQITPTPLPGHFELVLSNSSFSALTFDHRIPRTNFRNVLWNCVL